MVSPKTWAFLALALFAVNAAQAQAQENYMLTDSQASVGPEGAFLMNEQGSPGQLALNIPALDPLGLGPDTIFWVAEPYSVVAREGVGTATVTLDGAVDVAAATTLHIALHAYVQDQPLIQLGASDINFGVQELLPDTVQTLVDIDGALIPANALIVLEVTAQGTDVLALQTDLLDFLVPGPESGVSGITTRTLDSDQDGIPDTIEIILGSNPTSPDTDGDGFSDNEELVNGNDLNDPNNHPEQGNNNLHADTDGDGLTDAVEAALGTNATSADSDGDGWSDGSEAYYGSNPLDANSTPIDRDADGIPDAVDAFPTDPDANDNGIVDGEEDNDGDGTTDGEGYQSTPTLPIEDGVKQTLTNLGSTGSSEILTALGLASVGLLLAAIGLARI